MVRKVTHEAVSQIPEIQRDLEELADEWVHILEEVAGSYEWTLDQRRQMAVSKMRGSARDWHILDGVKIVGWDDWFARFLQAFGNELTLDQWVVLVQARERKDG